MSHAGARPSLRDRGKAVRRVSVLLVVVAVGIGVVFGIRKVLPLSPATGTLTGTFQAVGGPPGASPRALSGTITARAADRVFLSFPVGASGRFSVHAAVGTYTVSGRSPQYQDGTANCTAAGPVTVTKGVTSNVTVDCQEK